MLDIQRVMQYLKSLDGSRYVYEGRNGELFFPRLELFNDGSGRISAHFYSDDENCENPFIHIVPFHSLKELTKLVDDALIL